MSVEINIKTIANKIKLILLAILSTNCFLICIASGSAKNYENYRNIAIIAWGSLVKAPRNLAFEGNFKKLKITFPIELSCVSFQGTSRQKLTRIVDKHWGHPMTLWYVNAKNHHLDAAIENLAERETTSIEKIFYIKALLPNETVKETELLIRENNAPLRDNNGCIWCIEKKAAQQLPKKEIIELAKWATHENYNAAIWTGLSMTPGYDRAELINLLQNDTRTLENTQKYILNSPDLNELTQFEQNILSNDI